jgi:integrase
MPTYKLRREGKYWYIVGSHGRRSFHHSTRETEKARAQLVFDNWLREKLTPTDAKPDAITIDVVLRRYEDDKCEETTSVSTLNWGMETLRAYYKTHTVAYITATTNKEFERYCRKSLSLAKASINRMRVYLRAALKHAVTDGKLKYAPHIPILKVPKGKELWLTRVRDEQGDALAVERLYWAVLPKKYRHLNLFIRLALGTGARHRAILGLTWDRIDFQTGVIDFRDPTTAETNKRRPRAPVNDQLLRLLKAARNVKKGKYVIWHRGGQLKSVRPGFVWAIKRAGLPATITPHILKHTYITWLLRDGASIWDVAGLTNTTAKTIEAVYGHHARDGRMRDVANLVSRKSARIVPEQEVVQ